MQCPGCRSEMERLVIEGVLGQPVEIDLCRMCRAFWFDPFEDLHLTPAATVRLFGIIAEKGAGAASGFPAESRCPTCRARLLLTHDRQRNTPFTYWCCDRGHGRFTAFVEFLREKDFLRQPDSEQLAELRKSIRTIHCSNCGAPIDLMHQTVCGHCGAAMSILDMKKLAELAASSGHPGAAATPPRLVLPKEAAHSSATLLDLGFEAVTDWLHFLLRP